MDTLSLRTDVTSFNIQYNLCDTTNKINQAMQRISSGSKLNSAADGAANLSVSTKMEGTVSGLGVANDNIEMGISTLNAISSNYEQITTQLQRVRDLAVEASSGTYSESDCKAINEESSQLVDEIKYLISKNNDLISEHEFISSVDPISEAAAIAAGYDQDHIIHNASEFVSKISADSAGNFILVSNIDMSTLGTLADSAVSIFSGNFDGNGCSISNLTIDTMGADVDRIGLFGNIVSNAEIKNLGLNNININASNSDRVGGLAAESLNNVVITNCYVSGLTLSGKDMVGGLIGSAYDTSITDSYVQGDIFGADQVGGILGDAHFVSVSNCYTNINVNGSGIDVGGVAGGIQESTLKNISVTGNISNINTDADKTGGVAGYTYNCSIYDSYSTATVFSTGMTVGGLVGQFNNGDIIDSYSTGDVSGTKEIGGLVGYIYGANIENAYATGDVTGTEQLGGFVGYYYSGNIDNAYSTGDVAGIKEIGGFIGLNQSGITENAFASGNVSGTDFIGGFLGTNYTGSTRSAYSTGDVTGTNYVGGFFGANYSNTVEVAYATGNVIGTNEVGGFGGTVYGAVIADTYSSGVVSGSTYTGGFLGRQYGGSVDSTNYWDIQNSGQIASAGNAQGVPTSELPSIIIDPEVDCSNAGCQLTPDVITLQTGTKTNDTYTVKYIAIDIDLSGVDLSDSKNASDSLDILDNALTVITKQNTGLAASIKTLENKINVNDTQSMNLLKSNSTIKDANIAEEVANLTNQQILQNTNAFLLNEHQDRLRDVLLSMIDQV